jgi:hypothetical protein
LIDDKGCEFLIKAEWPCLSVLSLTSNYIESEGMKYLCKGSWPLLKKIKLSIYVVFSEQLLGKIGLL